MSRFTLPRDIYYGKGSIDELKNLKGKKAIVVVGGGSMKRFGFLDKVVNNLHEAGIETMLFEGVEPDPSRRNRYEGRQGHAGIPSLTGSFLSAAVLRLMPRRLCGLFMSIRRPQFEDLITQPFWLPDAASEGEIPGDSFHLRHCDGGDRVLRNYRL